MGQGLQSCSERFCDASHAQKVCAYVVSSAEFLPGAKYAMGRDVATGANCELAATVARKVNERYAKRRRRVSQHRETDSVIRIINFRSMYGPRQ